MNACAFLESDFYTSFPNGMNPNGFYPKTNRMNLILFIIRKYRSRTLFAHMKLRKCCEMRRQV